MKNKQTALQIFAISLICIFSIFLGSFYISQQNNTNQNYVGNSSYITTQTHTSQNLSGESHLIDPTISGANVIKIVLFNYSDDVTITGTELNNTINLFNSYLEYVSGTNFTTKMNNIGSIEYNFLEDNSNEPVFLRIDKPSTLNKQNLYNALNTTLTNFMTSNGIVIDENQLGYLFVYTTTSLCDFQGLSESNALSTLNSSYTGANAVYSPEVTVVNSNKYNNYAIIHGNIINAMNAMDSSSNPLTASVRNRAQALMFRLGLNYVGMPTTSYITSSGEMFYGYAGNWDILSNAPIYGDSYPYYSALNKFYAWKFGYLNDNFVEVITKTQTLTSIDFNANKLYIIEPTAKEYQGQAIVIQPFTNYGSNINWTEDTATENYPKASYGFIVARINTKYNNGSNSVTPALNADGSYKNASSDFIPFYVFTPSNTTEDETRNANSTLYNSYISPCADCAQTIGSLEKKSSETGVSHFNTGYISLFNNSTLKYDNSQLKITLIPNIHNPYGSDNHSLKIECNNSEVLPPVEGSRLITDIQDDLDHDPKESFIDYDVRILLYNIYIDYDLDNIHQDVQSALHISITKANLYYLTRKTTPELNWQDFYEDGQYHDVHKYIYDRMHTLSPAFTNLKYLDLNGGNIFNKSQQSVQACREITSLTFLSDINFVNLEALSIWNADFSTCNDDTSLVNLSYLSGLKNLKNLELISDNISSLNALEPLSEDCSLEKISVINNNLQDINILKQFETLTYANVSHNNLTDASLTESVTSTTSFYTDERFDIGLQRIPRSAVNLEQSTYIFESWRDSTIVQNRNAKVLSLSETFTTSTVQQSPHPCSTTDKEITSFALKHGKYVVDTLNILSLIGYTKGSNVARTIEPRSCICLFLSFTYDTEEICQSTSLSYYDHSIGAYSNLNELKNYISNRFVLNIQSSTEPGYLSYKYADDGSLNTTPINGDINLEEDGKYLIIYDFILTENFKTSLGLSENIEIPVQKTLIVYPYHAIDFNENASDMDVNVITDEMLYRTLLVISGKKQVTEMATTPKESLGTGDYIVYNQDLYFYKTDISIPSIASIRKEKSLIDNNIHMLTALNISTQARNIYVKQHPSIRDISAIPSGTQIIKSLAGLQYMNLESITELNLNSLGFSDLYILFDKKILPNIAVLNASDNTINLITNISHLNTLEYLDLSFNEISDATDLRTLTDPFVLQSNGIKTQKLKRVNIAFNLLDIGHDMVEDNIGSTVKYVPVRDSAGTCLNQTFVLDNRVPQTGEYLAQNQIYIVLVQMLKDGDVYYKTSKWQFYYTPACVSKDSMNISNKKFIFTTSSLLATSQRATEETFINKYSNSGYTVFQNYTQTVGRYSISMNFITANNTKDKLPFFAVAKQIHYTVVGVTIKNLESTYNNFPANILFGGDKVADETSLIYYMLSTEFESFQNDVLYEQYKIKRDDFIFRRINIDHASDAEIPSILKNELSKEDFITYFKDPNSEFNSVLADNAIVLTFSLNVTQLTLNYGAGTTYWNYYYGTNNDYWKNLATKNATSLGDGSGDDGELLPIQIKIIATDQSNNANLNERFVTFDFEVKFNRSNSFASAIYDDVYIFGTDALQLTETQRFTIKINILYNPEIKLSDDNLKKALLSVANKKSNESLYAYDFYNLETLNLSNCNISSFTKPNEEDAGFNAFIFSRLTKINLSHNNIENTTIASLSDPLFCLLDNKSIFSPSLNIGGGFIQIDFKLSVLDLSYNNITYLSTISDYCFGYQNLIVNLFANKIDFNYQSNYALIANDLATKAAGVIIGIQGINKETEYLISYVKDVQTHEDTNAKFYYCDGNIDPNNGYVLDAVGAEQPVVVYKDEEETKQLYRIYYYKNTFYQDNKNYVVNFRANYPQDIIINFHSTIVYQKLYINIEYDADGNPIQNDNKLYMEFMSDHDEEAFETYVNEILEKDVFTYENCNPSDFTQTYQLKDSYGNNELRPNKLTSSFAYEQIYSIVHKASNMMQPFTKLIYIVDTTSPTITKTKDTSQDKYIITKSKTYSTYVGSKQIDSDLAFYDEYDSYNNYTLQVEVTIYKDGELLSVTEGKVDELNEGFGISVIDVGSYKLVYVAIDSNGNRSEPYERVIEVYYQPYAWIKLSEFAASATASDIPITATVYRGENDVNKNIDPTFNWYIDGVYSHSTKKVEELSNETTFVTETSIFVQGAGTHNIEVYVDITKEEYDENTKINGFGDSGLAELSCKKTEVFILLDKNVVMWMSISIVIIIVAIVALVFAIKTVRRRKDLLRNKYDYTIEKHNRRK